MKNLTVAQGKASFQPVTITIGSPVVLASLLGALIAYGSAKKYAEEGLKAIGLGDFYNGNVRKSARELATEIAVASGNPAPDFSDYLGSSEFNESAPSKAGAAVIGTEDDLAPGREATTFETGGGLPVEDGTDNDLEDYGEPDEEEVIGY